MYTMLNIWNSINFIPIMYSVTYCMANIMLIFMLQVNRPLAMKKDGIQTRKRKPKNLKSAGSGNNTDSANSVKSEPSGKAVLKISFKQLFQLTVFLLHLWLNPFAYTSISIYQYYDLHYTEYL